MHSPLLENCTKIQGNYSKSADCAFFSWGTAYPDDDDNLGNCSAKPYTGSVCSKQLLAWQECTVGSVQDAVLLDLSNSEQSQEERERDTAQFLHFLCKLPPFLSA